MDLGVMIFPTDKSISMPHLAEECEARGYESLWVAEHTHIPVSRATPYPAGGDLPDEYRRCLDPFVALTAAAAVTERLRLGTGVCLVAQHDPIALAKSVASLDLVSGGRFLFGIGFGWNREEMQDHGIEPKLRRAIVRERMLAMKELWTKEVASFEGEHVSLSPSWMWPKPVQQPHPPILVGGAAGPTLFRHIVEYADGWMPIGGAGVAKSLIDLRQTAEEAGRDPATLQLTVYAALADDPAKLDYYASLGVTRTVFTLPPAGPDKVLPLLDRWAEKFLTRVP